MDKANEQFAELLSALRKCKHYCPWTKEQSVKSYLNELVDETREVKEAIEKNDIENLKEELGDVIWDVLMMAHIAEDQGLFKVEEVIESIVKKMKRRKPYAFEGRDVTRQEAEIIWKEAKQAEKDGNLS